MPRIKILVVEDDLFYQTYVNDLLAETDTDIINAADGEAGLEMAQSLRPDLILTDIEIPKIQGFVLLRKLREDERTSSIPVIMMSGKVEQGLLERHAQLSIRADEYLLKPFSSHQLFSAIRKVLADRAVEAALPGPLESGQIHNNGESTRKPVTPFPISDEETQAALSPLGVPGSEPSAEGPRKARVAVVVDDSPYILDVAGDFLREMGLEVVTATDGEEGLAVVRERHPDIVFLDVQMPRLNGFVVCERLKMNQETSGIPIVLMSAVVDGESFQRHSRLRHHADAYIQKPFMKRELMEMTSRLTSHRPPAPGVQEKTGFLLPQEGETTSGMPETAAAPGPQTSVCLEGDIEDARRRNAQLEKDLDLMRRQEDAFLAEIEDLSERLRQREQEQGTIDASFAQAKQGLEVRTRELEDEVKEAESRAAAGESLARAQEGRIAELQEKLRRQEDLRERELKESEARVEEALLARDLEHAEMLSREKEGLGERIGALEEGASRFQARLEQMEAEKSRLLMDLNAARAAKAEIEEQAKAIVQSRDSDRVAAAIREENVRLKSENAALAGRLSEAEASARWASDLQERLNELTTSNVEMSELLEKTRRELKEADRGEELERERQEAESLREAKIELSESVAALEGERDGLREESRRLRGRVEELEKMAGKSAREESESLARRKKLESDLEDAGLKASREEESRREAEKQKVDLERRLGAEKAIREEAEAALAGLRRKLEGAAREVSEASNLRSEVAEAKGAAETLRSERDEAREALDKIRSERDELRKRIEVLERGVRDLEESRRGLEERLAQSRAEGAEEEKTGGSGSIGERLSQLEEILQRTVSDAQAALLRQQERESNLEQSMRNIARSLEEERAEFRREREAFISREDRMKAVLEEMMEERRHLIGEDASRYIPVQMAREAPPLKVVGSRRWYGLAAAALLVICAFFLGYLTLSRIGKPTGASEVANPSTAPVPQADLPQANRTAPDAALMPTVAFESARETYERLWRRQTVQSVSEDIHIWATLHTREELSAATRLASSKEGWTAEKNERALSDLYETYRLDEAYYVTVHVRNLRGGYPGYADGIESHIFLRDGSGRETPAGIPDRLKMNKFITSRVTSAGKEADPALLYEVGVTVAFPKGEAAGQATGLGLVIYDVGSIPARMLTWDLQGWGHGV